MLYAVAGAFLVLPLVFGPEREGRVRSSLTGPVPFWLGEISYGIFAIHMFVLNWSSGRSTSTCSPAEFTVALLTLRVTLVLATVSFYLFEKPDPAAQEPGPFVPRGNQRQQAREPARGLESP